MKKSNDAIVITGIGMISPYGNTLEQFFNGLKVQEKAEKAITVFNSERPASPCGVEITLPPSCSTPESRLTYMGGEAVCSAIADWGGSLKDVKKVGLIVGSGLGLEDQLSPEYSGEYGADYFSTLGEALAEYAGIEAEVIYCGNACCAGSQGISYGMDLLEEGCLDIVIAGGVDVLSQMAYKGFLRLNALDLNGCRPFDSERKGIMVGEGAAFFVLQKASYPIKTAGKAYCVLAGAGVTNDAYHVVQMKPDGSEILRAMKEALFVSGLSKEDIGLVVAHGTGTILNDKNEARFILEFFNEKMDHVWVTAPKGAIGHTGGASGPFGMLVAIGAILYGEIPPVSNLKTPDTEVRIPIACGDYKKHNVYAAMVNAFAFGGTNVVIVCKKCSVGC